MIVPHLSVLVLVLVQVVAVNGLIFGYVIMIETRLLSIEPMTASGGNVRYIIMFC